MKFSIAFVHGRTTLIFLVKVEKDDIFIACPKLKRGTGEAIFLTRVNGQWVGDCDNKKMVEKIGLEIDNILQQKAVRKRKPA